MARSERNVLLTVFVTIFLDLLGFGIIIPILPFYAEQFGAAPSTVTWLGASYSLMQLIFAPFWGRLSDRFGRRPIILTSVATSMVGYALFAMADDLTVLFAARLIAGFGNANIGTAQAAIADSTTADNRAKGMGLIGAAFGLGFIIGPALGGVMGQISTSAPAWLASGLALGNLVMAFFLFMETNPPEARAARSARPRVPLSLLLRTPAVSQVLLVGLLLSTGFSMIEQTLGLLIEEVWVIAEGPRSAGLQRGSEEAYRLGAGLTAQYLFFVGVTGAIVQGVLLGRLSRRFGEKGLIGTGLVLIAVGFLVVALVSRVGGFTALIPTAFLLAAGTGLANPSLSSLLSKISPSDIQGRSLGIGQSASALGRVLGPSASGYLFEHQIQLPFETGAVLMLAALLALGFVPASRTNAESSETT